MLGWFCLFFNSSKHGEWGSCLATSSSGTTVIFKFLSNATHPSCQELVQTPKIRSVVAGS